MNWVKLIKRSNLVRLLESIILEAMRISNSLIIHFLEIENTQQSKLKKFLIAFSSNDLGKTSLMSAFNETIKSDQLSIHY